MKTYSEKLAEARDKVGSLPKWAQEYIRHLEQQAGSAEQQLAEIKEGPADSSVFRVWGLQSSDQALGKNAQIRFQVGDLGWRDSIIVRPDRQRLLHIGGTRQLIIEPQSSNSIRVRQSDD